MIVESTTGSWLLSMIHTV